MLRAIISLLFMAVLVFGATHPAAASKPVPRTLTGCVINGALYSVYPGKPQYTVYRIKVKDLNLSPYEGKKISISGNLLPGDTFYPKPGTLKVLGPCDRKSQEAIGDRMH